MNNTENFTINIANLLGIREFQVKNVIELLNDGATIPFIARYRKEVTGSLDEVKIGDIKLQYEKHIELENRRNTILQSIKEQGKLTKELEKQILSATTLTDLEDLYLPYRPKRRTKASVAKEKGLEPLAEIIFNQDFSYNDSVAEKFINTELEVKSAEEAIDGARDIIAEWINEDKPCRDIVRNLYNKEAVIYSKMVRGKELEGIKYEDYYEWNEPLDKTPSHRLLAMYRGENEGFLKISIYPETEKAHELLKKKVVKNNSTAAKHVELAIADSYKRLLQPSIETEYRNIFKEKADEEAIKVFSDNLRQLLMSPPLGQKTVLAIDPGFRTGCKIVILSPQGKLLHNETIYPHPPQNDVKQSINKIKTLVKSYKVDAIAIGNGTAGRETENLIKKIRFEDDIIAVMVNESGASIYSASEVAREEFPDYDITVRGAVSIGRRLMDPLSELVKIDPKSIGVGQYQHDVNQNKLQDALTTVVESCVNQVGVELNTASKELLSYVSGIGNALAKNIVNYREENGKFTSRNELKKVPRLGEKAFEQAAGFLRIKDAENPLDESAVHPESYHIAYNMAEKLNCDIKQLINNPEIGKKINPKDFITDTVGLPTIVDIISELEKPGRDPRKNFEIIEFNSDINSIDDLKEGIILNGVVTNITNFGAFVDIGVGQDGLVHISQLANKFVKSPHDIVKLNQKVKVKVVKIEKEKKRIQLSMKNL
ncbi:MAG: Tex family protein [Bacteroidales bacterium]|jgi:uncharacterized protein